jgi:hypothetical protein
MWGQGGKEGRRKAGGRSMHEPDPRVVELWWAWPICGSNRDHPSSLFSPLIMLCCFTWYFVHPLEAWALATEVGSRKKTEKWENIDHDNIK